VCGTAIAAGIESPRRLLTRCVTIRHQGERSDGTRLGLQIPNFSYDAPVTELFPAVKAQAQEAEAAGFDTVLLMDHFLPTADARGTDEPMLEAYTALGALASATKNIQLSTLVTAAPTATRRCSPR